MKASVIAERTAKIPKITDGSQLTCFYIVIRFVSFHKIYCFTCKERIYGARTPPRPPPSDPMPSPIVRTDVGNNSAVYVYTTENDA